MDALRSALIQTGMFREDDEGKLQNIPVTAAQMAGKTDSEKLALMVAMHTAAVAIGTPDGMSEAETEAQLKSSEETIGKLTVKVMNAALRADHDGKASKSKKRSVAKTPYQKQPGGGR